MNLINEKKHSYAAIEGPRQFQRGDIAGFGEPFEKRWQRPAAAIQFKRNFVAVDTRRFSTSPPPVTWQIPVTQPAMRAVCAALW